MKRTREDLSESNADTQILVRPKKRRNISTEGNQEDIEVNDEDHVVYSSSPHAQHHQRRNSKPSSQASRVDLNGSPRALVSAEKVDHFSKVTRKLLQDQQQVDNGEEKRTLNSSHIFAPRPRLASIPKTGPSSPQNEEARYVKHQKIGNGRYEGVETKEIVVPEKFLADPFMGGAARRSSGFTKRLQGGSAKEDLKSEAVQQTERPSAPTQDQTGSNAATKPTQAAIREPNGHSNETTIAIYDEQTTLVNSGTQLPSSPSDMTGASTIDGGQSPLSESGTRAWNVTLRSHYGDLSNVAHRLVDVSTFS